MPGRFEVYEDSAGEYRFRLKAANGEIVLRSEGYAAKSGALNGIESVQANAPIAERFEALETASGQFRFNLKAANNQIIGTSDLYSSSDTRDGGIEAVGRAVADARIEDLTAQA